MMLITMMMTVTMMIIDQVVYQEAKGIGDKGVDYEEIIDHDGGDEDDDRIRGHDEVLVKQVNRRN